MLCMKHITKYACCLQATSHYLSQSWPRSVLLYGVPRSRWITSLTSVGLNRYDIHYNDVIMSVMVSQITSLMIVYSSIDWGADQRKHQSSASLAFVRVIHRWSVNSPHKGPVTHKMFPFDDVIMLWWYMASPSLSELHHLPEWALTEMISMICSSRAPGPMAAGFVKLQCLPL